MDTTYAISLHQHLQVSLDHGADIHASIDQGFTTIHLAAGSCNLELVLLLLINTADVHARVAREDHSGGINAGPTSTVESNTPLRLTVASDHDASTGEPLEVLKALLDHGADIEANEGSGKTPLLLAI